MSDLRLPQDLYAERTILGALMMDRQAYESALGLVTVDHFSIEKHRRIFAAMKALESEIKPIDHITVANQLIARKQLESVDGLSYLNDLDVGIPAGISIECSIDRVLETFRRRRLMEISMAAVQQAQAGNETSAEVAQFIQAGLEGIHVQPANGTASLMTIGEVVEDAGGINAFCNPMQGRGVDTPWKPLTEFTNGFRRGELCVLAANTGMGKTAAALQIAAHAASQGEGAMVVSLEMSRVALAQRLVCAKARVDGFKYRGGYLNQEERSRIARSLQTIMGWPLWIVEHGMATVPAIRIGLAKMRVKHDVFILAIDYLQLMHGLGRYPNRHSELSEITRALKLIAIDERVNVHLLSQLSRDNMKEKRRPILSDLRESGSIEENADSVLFIWREEVIRRDREDLRGQAEFIMAKQRSGPTGKIDLVWLAHLTKFENRAEDVIENKGRWDHDD